MCVFVFVCVCVLVYLNMSVMVALLQPVSGLKFTELVTIVERI